MKERIMLIFTIPLILGMIINGCGKKAEKDVSGSVQQQEKTGNDTSAILKDQLVSLDKNTGVVTDTVTDVFREAATQSERVTQALYNQPVTILEEKENWLKVKVADGYTGWVRARFVDRDFTCIMAEKFKYRLVVTAKTKKIYTQINGGLTLKDVVMGTELYSKNKSGNWYEVSVPGNATGWVSESGLIQLSPTEHIPKTSVNDFISTVNKFPGTNYLWGGVSSWGGIDCSGLAYICSRINGVDLPRDTDQQIEKGEEVDVENISPGDLVFFSTNEDLSDVTHVGIIIDGTKFINASKSKGSVTINSLGEDYYRKRLVGVRRLF